MPRVRYRIHRWESTDTAVYTQTGWLSRERRIAPMSRVQTVDFEQGPIDRLLGLASVTVTTASAAGPLADQRYRQAGGRPVGRRPDPSYGGRGGGRDMTEAYPPYPPPTGTPQFVPDVPWRRLDPRMLLVHPVVELVKFLPFLIGIFVLGSNGNQGWWQLFGVAVPIVLGIMRFLTTTFRITPTQIELQRGLIGRKVLTARLDRVRAVELTSTPIHRLLGLAKVEVGTASGAKQDDDKFALDSSAARGGPASARGVAAPGGRRKPHSVIRIGRWGDHFV